MITIKNIIFDLGGVILKETPISILKDRNINNDIYNELKKFFLNRTDLDLGKITLEEKFNNCNFKEEIKSKYKDLLINYYKYRTINMKLINLIDSLKRNNYNIYILSDNNREAYEYYKNNPLFKNINGFVISCEYHTLKKDGVLFEKLLEKYNLNPKECYFIDDNKINLLSAKKYNLKTYLFNEKDDINLLYNDMRKNKITI